jgi:hypothetical protein
MVQLLAQAASDPLGERVLVAATGPLVTVIVGGLIVWGITFKIQKSREDAIRTQAQARADAEANRELRARDDELRHELVTMMSESAGALYLLTQHYWRAKDDLRKNAGDTDLRQALQDLRPSLDAQYLKSRASAEAVEYRLRGYFIASRPRDEWHKAQDLLTVRYFQLIDRDTEALYKENEGPAHTHLSVAELRIPKTLLSTYRSAMKAAVDAVFSEALRARSSET